jgi:hypothetical protein
MPFEIRRHQDVAAKNGEMRTNQSDVSLIMGVTTGGAGDKMIAPVISVSLRFSKKMNLSSTWHSHSPPVNGLFWGDAFCKGA